MVLGKTSVFKMSKVCCRGTDLMRNMLMLIIGLLHGSAATLAEKSEVARVSCGESFLVVVELER